MDIHKDGFEVHRNFISPSAIQSIKNEVEASIIVESKHGIRHANEKFNSIQGLATSEKLMHLVSAILGSEACIVRVIYFDKTPQKNWLVTWHQDKTIALNKKEAIKGWGVWSIKDNTYHVQPPLEVLNKMITFRLHLDNADRNNGCLKVIPKSHHLGILPQSEITAVVKNQDAYFCELDAGDLLLMRPHLLHSSSKSLNPKHRRVVHIEYSNYDLPLNLKWA